VTLVTSAGAWRTSASSLPIQRATRCCNLAHHAALGIYPATHAKMMNAGRSAGMGAETRAQLATADINDLPDSDFAYIEPGGTKDASGKTVPRSLRHFPVHDKAHVQNALSRAPQSPFGAKAMPKIRAAAAKFGVHVGGGDGGRSMLADEEVREVRITSIYKDLDQGLEIRDMGSEGKWIGGYASVFMPRESRNLGGFIERVAPDAFSESRAAGWPNVVCRFNHNSDIVLGTIWADTLRLKTDSIGLDYQARPPESRTDVREGVLRGDIKHSSFAFRVPVGGDEWGVTDQNFPMRTLRNVELVDVAPVLTPAYPDATAAVRATSAALRSLADWAQIAVDEVRALADADELRRLFIRTDKPIYRPEPKKLFGPAAATMLLARRTDPYDQD
jgi:HK97 family phage prohead protease